MALFGIHFIYRYGAVRKEFFDKFLSGRKSQLLFAIPVIYGFSWGALCFFRIRPDKFANDYMRKNILDYYEFSIENLSYICVIFYSKLGNGKFVPNYPVFYTVSCFWFMIISSVASVFYFGINCYIEISTTLAQTTIISNYNKSLQSQLFQALVVQTMIPIILMYIPISILFASPMLLIDIGCTGRFVATMVAIFPAIDPLPNMLIIKAYRKAIFKFFRTVFKKVDHENVTRTASVMETNLGVMLQNG